MIHIQLRKEPASKRFSREHSPRFADDCTRLLSAPNIVDRGFDLLGGSIYVGRMVGRGVWAISGTVDPASSNLQTTLPISTPLLRKECTSSLKRALCTRKCVVRSPTPGLASHHRFTFQTLEYEVDPKLSVKVLQRLIESRERYVHRT